MRYSILDGFRGFFLLFMAVAHFDGLVGSWLAKAHHQNFGWVEDAQGFVFISGLVVGLVYGKKFLRAPSVRAIFGPILARVRTIYAYQAGLVLILLAAGLALGRYAPTDFAQYQAAPGTFAVSSLLLMSSSPNMGILPIYIFFLLATPFAFALLHRGHLAPYFAAIVLAWLAAQSNLAGWSVYQLQLFLNDVGAPARFGLYFNPLGWQALFFCGLFIGFRMAQGRLDLSFLRQPQWRPVFLMAIVAVFLLGVYDLAIQNFWLGEDYSVRILSRSDRAVLGLIYPIAFALDLFLVVWLMQVGRDDRAAWVRRAGAGLTWFFTRPALVMLGQHSLQVFAFHILVYYFLATVMRLVDPPEAVRAGILIVSVASLYLAAFAHRWWLQREAAAAAVAAE